MTPMTPEEQHNYDMLMANELRLNQIDKEERIKFEKEAEVLTLGQLNDLIDNLEEQIDHCADNEKCADLLTELLKYTQQKKALMKLERSTK